jgi:hypothetical protein
MSKYREGQTVRIVWPNGTLIEGVLNGFVTVTIPPTGFHVYVEDGTYTRDGRVITILSEPRPDEPTGLGAVVKAYEYPGSPLRTWVLTDWDRPWTCKGRSSHWSNLIDPVVMDEGWTPTCTCKDHRSLHEVSCPMYSER